MISNRRILLAALGVFNIVLIAVAFLVARSYNGVFWTGLVFNLLGASGFGYFSVFAYDRGSDSLRETPQNLACFSCFSPFRRSVLTGGSVMCCRCICCFSECFLFMSLFC